MVPLFMIACCCLRRSKRCKRKSSWLQAIPEIVTGTGGTIDEFGETCLYPDWGAIEASRGCLEELADNKRIRARVPKIDIVIAQVSDSVKRLQQSTDPSILTQVSYMNTHELAAIVAYTHDLRQETVDKSGNLFFELNNALRVREQHGRLTTIRTWGVYMRYAMDGLRRLPNYTSEIEGESGPIAWLYRGMPGAGRLVRDYTPGRTIKWRAFSSTTTDMDVAMEFGNACDNLVFRINACCGKQISMFSAFGDEREVLLLPGAQFKVMSQPYVGPFGVTFIDLREELPTLVF